MSAMDVKLGLITGRRMGSVIRGGGGRQFVTHEKSAAWIPTLAEIDAMFFMHLWMVNAIFWTCCV